VFGAVAEAFFGGMALVILEKSGFKLKRMKLDSKITLRI
jgi:hypothetical protein